jgi:hypothetical protein
MFGSSPTPYEQTAFHEASHAVAAVRLGVTFERVTMSVYQCTAREGDTVGGLHLATEYRRLLNVSGPADAADRPKIENLVIVAIAGEAGQARMEQRPCDMGLDSAKGDYEIVKQLAGLLYADPADRDAFIERQKVAAWELVSESLCYRQIECVAGQLRVPLELSFDAVVGWMEFEARRDD